MKTVNFGIIGAGRMGNLHAGHIALTNNARVTGVYDIKPDAALAMHEQYGAEIYNSVVELVNSANIDGIIITSPTYCHIEAIRIAVAAKKAIFCEKPMTRTLKDAYEVLALLKGYSKLFTIGFVRRYMKKSQKVKQLLDQGLIGRLRYCNIDLPFGAFRRVYGDWFTDFDKSGGVIIDMLAHHVDLANWFFGEAKSVYAAGMLLDRTQELPSDYVASIVKYKNGLICNMMCNWQHFGRSNEQMEIYGDKGALILDGTDNVTFYPLNGEKQQIDISIAADPAGGVDQVNVGNGFQIEMEHIIAAINGEPIAKMPTAQDGLRSLEIGLAMIKSAQADSVVILPIE